MLGTKGMNLILKNDKDPKIGNLWLGSYDAIRNAEQLKSNNITCVVSVVDAISVRLPEDLWIEQKVILTFLLFLDFLSCR